MNKTAKQHRLENAPPQCVTLFALIDTLRSISCTSVLSISFRSLLVEIRGTHALRHLMTRLTAHLRGKAERKLTGRYQIHVKVRFPHPVGIDLLLQSRPCRQEQTTLASHYQISATNAAMVYEVLSEDLISALVELAKHSHRVRMTDNQLIFHLVVFHRKQAAEMLLYVLSALSEQFGSEATTAVLLQQPQTIAETSDRFQADLWRSKLESAGIRCQVSGYEQSPPWANATPPVSIWIYVEESDVKAARATLNIENTSL